MRFFRWRRDSKKEDGFPIHMPGPFIDLFGRNSWRGFDSRCNRPLIARPPHVSGDHGDVGDPSTGITDRTRQASRS